jgi:hypothetical protein
MDVKKAAQLVPEFEYMTVTELFEHKERVYWLPHTSVNALMSLYESRCVQAASE